MKICDDIENQRRRRCAFILTQAESTRTRVIDTQQPTWTEEDLNGQLYQPVGPEASLILLHGSSYGMQRMTTVTTVSAEYKEYDEQRVPDLLRFFFAVDCCWLRSELLSRLCSSVANGGVKVIDGPTSDSDGTMEGSLSSRLPLMERDGISFRLIIWKKVCERIAAFMGLLQWDLIDEPWE